MLKNRECKIVKKLIRTDSPLVIKELAAELSVSTRTIRYDLDKIEDWIEEEGLKMHRKQGIGIYLESNAKDKLTEILDLEIEYHRAYTPEERQHIILKELLAREEPIIVKEFEINLDVSEGTIIKDLNKVEKWLAKRDLELIRKPNYGIEIKGDENNWRKAVFDFLEDSSTEDEVINILNLFENTKSLPSFIDSYSDLLNSINSTQVKFVKNLIRDTEKDLDYSFTDAAFSALILHIVIALQRIIKNKDINMKSKQLLILKNKKEFKIAEEIVKKLSSKFKIEIPESEIGYITLHLLGAKFRHLGDFDFKADKLFDDKLLDLTYQLVGIAAKILNLELTNDQELIYGLALHLKPTLNRIKYDLNIENQLVADIQEKYPQIYRASKIAAGVIQTEIFGEIREEEIGFIAMHIGAAVERKNVKSKLNNKLKVALVCSTGIGTTQILAERLKNEFPNLKIVDTYSYHDLEAGSFEKEIELVISTIKLPGIGINKIQVNPLLKEEDIKNIENYIINIFNNKIYQKNKKIEECEGLRGKVNTDIDQLTAETIELLKANHQLLAENDLENELKELFKEHLKEEAGDNKKEIQELELSDILNPGLIRAKVRCKDWKEAVKKSGKLLSAAGMVSENYIKNMIGNIEERGPYVVITPGLALVHAAPERGVKKVGISLITLSKAVNFNHSQNDPVEIVVAFASPDKEQHVKALSNLVDKLYNSSLREEIISTEDNQKILDLLKN
ncbi:BglG family transcriptional antiterminator [Halanaerobium saccharolyticum]|uniref:BglG family transcriptional antiterminator n=1 Tax=Halanaerobium saccharolyticum TaxID=43595 RepID=A0A4R6LZE3_9FIRM|nr:BglG family transcription antiterminator [Halanaerobium saccharolyticum]TDO94174.1 BglG family transcriptional antiterminator [Halanaerobium saccharolyticum]